MNLPRSKMWIPFAAAMVTVSLFWVLPAPGYVTNLLETFKEFPPPQKAASFTIDRVLDMLQTPMGK